jgi:hypothetical protein
MRPTDNPILFERLCELADAVGGKKPTQAGLKVWYVVLKEYDLPNVVNVLDNWARRSGKMPAPNDVFKVLNDSRVDKMESDAESAKRGYAADAARTFRRCPEFARKIHALAADLNVASPSRKHDPKDWARVIYARFVADRPANNGQPLSYIQVHEACRALNKTIAAAHEERDERRAAAAAVAA